MATDHIKEVTQGIVNTLRTASELDGYLTEVHSYPAFAKGYNQPNKLTIYVLVGDSSEEIPFTNETTQTDILPTTFAIVCDTKLPADSEAYETSGGYGETLLDHEYRVLRALQANGGWFEKEGNHMGWLVSSIERNVEVAQPNGEPDPDVDRFVITLTVDTFLDRDDGPAR